MLQAPAGNNSGVTNGSASVPLQHDPGLRGRVDAQAAKRRRSSCKTREVRLQAMGTPTDPVTFTSYNDASIGGATNNNPDTNPFAGDWGGIVFRNYDEAIAAQRVSFPVDGILVGPGGGASGLGRVGRDVDLELTPISGMPVAPFRRARAIS